MASWKYTDDSNLGAFTLGSGYTSASGTMSLTAGHGARLPSTGDFWIGYDTGSGVRIFKVTARSTDTLTVVADATEGIGDGNISSGETLRPVVTNAAIDQLKADIIAASGLVLLRSISASASASLDIATRTDGTAIIQSDFDDYLIKLIAIVPATNAVTLRMRMSTDGGSTYDSSSLYTYANFHWRAAGVTQNGSEALVSAALVNHFAMNSSASWPGIEGSLEFFNPGSSRFKNVIGKCTFLDSAASNRIGIEVKMSYESTTAVNAFQFYMSSGNITSGTIRVYGIAKS